jgi:hypothetical protein
MRILIILIMAVAFSGCAGKGLKKPAGCSGEFKPINGISTAATIDAAADIKC